MKNPSDYSELSEDYMRKEYEFDYSKGVRGKYFRKATEENGYVKLIPEVQEVFKTSELVNKALLSIIKTKASPKKAIY